VLFRSVNYTFGNNGKSEYVASIFDNGRFLVKGVYSKKEVALKTSLLISFNYKIITLLLFLFKTREGLYYSDTCSSAY
jgi:hypothetical protein